MENKALKVKEKILNYLEILEITAIIFILLSIFLKSLIFLTLGIGAYIAFRIIVNIVWVCPNCKKNLPKKSVEEILECRWCNYPFK